MGDIELRGELLTLHQGSVGVGKHEATASYVLVDAVNRSKQSLDVTLGGHLTNGAGEAIGELDKQSLQIPAGETRTFALVEDDKRALDEAGGARLRVSSANLVQYPAKVKIEEVNVQPDGDRVVVAGYVHNTAKNEAAAVVIASFYDLNDRPMKRPSTTFRLTGAGRRGVQFVGPPGSKRATLFIGQIAY